MMISRRINLLPALGSLSIRAFATSAKKDDALHPARLNVKKAKRVVVKVGTAVVVNTDGSLALSRMGGLVEQLAQLNADGREVLLVSSGAMGLGRQSLGLTKEHVGDTTNIIDRQACAAAGQNVLMSMYTKMFNSLDLKCSQVLITQGDFLSRQRYTFLTETLDALTSSNVIPIINENDVVTGGITGQQVFSDNDSLASILAAGSDADALALLTDVEAVYTKPPDEPGSERIKVFTPEVGIEIGSKSSMGRGGMAAKIAAARVAASGGVNVVVASGFDLGNIHKSRLPMRARLVASRVLTVASGLRGRVFNGEDVGTLFPAAERPNKRQRWLTLATGSEGALTVTQEAKDLIASGLDAPLLMAQVTAVSGDFDERAVVSIVDPAGTEFARGICTKCSTEIEDAIPSCGSLTFNSSHTLVANNEYVLIST